MSRPVRASLDRHVASRRPAGRWLPTALIALLSLPLLIDCVRLCHAQWLALFGPVPSVHTPAIDLVELYATQAYRATRRLLELPTRRLPWKPQWAVGALAASLAIGTLIMRQHRPR